MTAEGQNIDRKSLKMLAGKAVQWKELAKDCVCFANARGGTILIGIEDGAAEPPHGQIIPKDLPAKIRKRVGDGGSSVPLTGWS
jgi:ATP-dependent DNA helicase RecG